jgi:hypothetical protein
MFVFQQWHPIFLFSGMSILILGPSRPLIKPMVVLHPMGKAVEVSKRTSPSGAEEKYVWIHSSTLKYGLSTGTTIPFTFLS